MEQYKTERLTVIGMVQGVGYRPFVARQAERIGITGEVVNNRGIVTLTAYGTPEALDRLAYTLLHEPPEGARVDSVQRQPLPLQPFHRFTIGASRNDSPLPPLVPPDLTTCPRCIRELHDPSNRRFHYPFISCVSCGPRYSIIDRLPYDRCNTTMEDFPMCPDCRSEYTAPLNIRRHAQTIACHSCGPTLHCRTATGETHSETALHDTITILRSGGIAALRDIGGFHLACNPNSPSACSSLRQLKARETKPFAVLFPSIPMIQQYCVASAEELSLLQSNPRPIVLLKKRRGMDFAPEVCSGSLEIGVMLPCNPLQLLLAEACGALVMTSANRSGEPMLTDNKALFSWQVQSPLLTAVVWHERRILMPMDDSVSRVIEGAPQLFRRGRGYVPEPIALPHPVPKPTLAIGGDLKSCFALCVGDRAYLSQHFGDLEDLDCSDAFEQGIAHMKTIFGIAPEQVVCDLHPNYRSREIATGLNLPLLTVQHHHAHVLSTVAECQLSGCVLGVAFDGTGWGSDGTVWGSEYLLCHLADCKRVGHLSPVPLLGGDEGARNAGDILRGFLRYANIPLDEPRFHQICAILDHGVNRIVSSSMGRLFDAAAALLGICSYNRYEGECPIRLEQAAALAEESIPLTLPVIEQNGVFISDSCALIRQLWQAQSKGANRNRLALGFHHAIADSVLTTCKLVRTRFGVSQIALCGGTFQNRILLEQTAMLLRSEGFFVFYNRQVPPGDGGLCLGQALFAASMCD